MFFCVSAKFKIFYEAKFKSIELRITDLNDEI